MDSISYTFMSQTFRCVTLHFNSACLVGLSSMEPLGCFFFGRPSLFRNRRVKDWSTNMYRERSCRIVVRIVVSCEDSDCLVDMALQTEKGKSDAKVWEESASAKTQKYNKQQEVPMITKIKFCATRSTLQWCLAGNSTQGLNASLSSHAILMTY